MGCPTKNDHFGVWNGGKPYHLRKHPSVWDPNPPVVGSSRPNASPLAPRKTSLKTPQRLEQRWPGGREGGLGGSLVAPVDSCWYMRFFCVALNKSLGKSHDVFTLNLGVMLYHSVSFWKSVHLDDFMVNVFYGPLWDEAQKIDGVIPSRSLTTRPWEVTFPIGKDRLPTINFRGRTVKLRRCIGTLSECDSPIFQLLKDAKNTPQQLLHSQPQQSFVWRAFNPKKLLPSGPTWNSTSWQNAEIAHLRWHNIKYLILFFNWGPDRVCRRILKHNLHAFVFGIWP